MATTDLNAEWQSWLSGKNSTYDQWYAASSAAPGIAGSRFRGIMGDQDALDDAYTRYLDNKRYTMATWYNTVKLGDSSGTAAANPASSTRTSPVPPLTQSANNNALRMVETSNYGKASDLTSRVLQQTQKHLEQTFQQPGGPEDTLISNLTYNNPALMADAISGGTATVNRAYDNSRSGALGQFRQYGIAPNERQMTALNQADNLHRTASVVDAANKIRTKMLDRDRQIAAGGIGAQASSLSATGG